MLKDSAPAALLGELDQPAGKVGESAQEKALVAPWRRAKTSGTT
jgi:hypothetical protein